MWPWSLLLESRAPAPPQPVAAAVSPEPSPAESFQFALMNRAHQQAAVSALGQEALMGVDMATLLDHAIMFVAQMLSVEIACIHRFDDDGQSLHTAASCGLPQSLLRQSLPGGPRSMARYIVESAEPVIIRNLRSTTRFDVPFLFSSSHATSGVSVVIPLADRPWGILQAYTKRLRSFGEDDFHFLQSVANVISTAYQRREAEKDNAKLAAFAQFNPNPVLEFSAAGEITYFNDAARALTAALGRTHPTELLPENCAAIVESCLVSAGNVLAMPVEIEGRTIEWSYFPIPAIQRVHAYAVDVTERLNLEAQLRQSQKMEAIGQLAAGVAHDFNNILTIMQGLVRKVEAGQGDPEETLQQMFDTTERAAAFTRQLLAFSRRQVLQPRVIDVREVVSGVSRMLQRLIGEDIVLTVNNGEDVPTIEADPSMVEQILLNLAVNARDAMPRGGQLIITNDAVAVPESEDTQRLFVRLVVQDTGCGMTDEVKARIFEPFFTTKEAGKGTGLGLATVFGIVKQHGGAIEVVSEPGRGTSFSVLLPACDKPIDVAAEPAPTVWQLDASGSETILLVEDEPLLRELAQSVLTDAGYKVLEAGECDEAFNVWREHEREIDLLLTDMVLPGGMNGRDLAIELQQSKPGLKVIYTTGYSQDIVGLDTDPVNFLQKPYPPEVLTHAVRACLDA